jgi:hypothetical protein
MAKITFLKEPDETNQYDKSTIELKFEDTDRAEFIEEFVNFLSAIGYSTIDLRDILSENGLI